MNHSKCKAPEAKFNGLEKECRTMCEWNYDRRLALLPKQGNTNQEFL